MTEKEFNNGLQKHLMKCELEYRAKMLPMGSKVDWLGEHCGSVEEIARFLRDLGFRVGEIMDEVDCTGEAFRWVKTTNGITVYVNEGGVYGLIAKGYVSPIGNRGCKRRNEGCR